MAKAKTKLPKTLAGIKVPKAIRKSRALDTLIGSRLGREILAEALVAATTAAAAVLVKHRSGSAEAGPSGDAAEKASADGSSARETVQGAAGTVAEVIKGAASALLPGSASDGKSDSAPEPKTADEERPPEGARRRTRKPGAVPARARP